MFSASPRFFSTLLALTLAVTLLYSSGCQVAGYAAHVLFPEKSTPLYDLQHVSTLVIVEDSRDQLTHPVLAGRMRIQIEDLITTHLAAEQEEGAPKISFVDGSAVGQLAARHEDFPRWSVGRIGRELGATQVIYVALVEWQLYDEGGSIYHPRSTVLVRVINAETGERAFPAGENSQGLPVSSRLFYRTLTETQQNRIAEELASETGQNVARLFYEYILDQSGNQLPD